MDSPTNENKLNFLPALTQFGLTSNSVNLLKTKDFTEILAFHFIIPPEKIEFLTHISGLKFDDSFRNCDHLATEDGNIPFLCYEDLIINKISAGRLKDQADVEELQKIHRKK